MLHVTRQVLAGTKTGTIRWCGGRGGNEEYFPVITNRIFGCSFGIFLCAGGQYIFAYFLLQLFMCLPKGLFEVLLTSSRHAKKAPTRGGKNRKDFPLPHFEYLGKVKSLRQEVITP